MKEREESRLRFSLSSSVSPQIIHLDLFNQHFGSTLSNTTQPIGQAHSFKSIVCYIINCWNEGVWHFWLLILKFLTLKIKLNANILTSRKMFVLPYQRKHTHWFCFVPSGKSKVNLQSLWSLPLVWLFIQLINNYKTRAKIVQAFVKSTESIHY